MEEDLGDQVEGGRQAVRRYVDADAQGVPARFGVERGAQPLGRLDEGDRLIPLGALGQGPGGQHGGAGLIGRLLSCAAHDDHRRRHERTSGQVDDEDRQAVGQLTPGDRRELVAPWRAGCRPLGHDRAVAGFVDGRAHAATSSASPRSPASSAGSVTSSALVPSGR